MIKSRSVLKRAKQNEVRSRRNTSVKTRVKRARKKVLTLLMERQPSQAKETLKESISIIAKAAAKKVIHKKKGARYISRLTRRLNELVGPAGSEPSPAPGKTP